MLYFYSNTNVSVMTGQRRVDPFAVRYLLDRIKTGKGQHAKQEYQRQGRDVNNTRQNSGSTGTGSEFQGRAVRGQHRDNNQQDG